MAYNAGAVITQFKANMRELSAGIKKGQQELNGFAKGAKRTGQKMKSIGTKMSMYITTPLALATGAATKFGMDFEDAMQKSVSIMDGVSDDIRKKMERVARDVALDPEVDKSAKEAAEAYFYLASAGLDAQQSMEALPKVARFATAGQFDMATATDLLTDSQSALGLTVDDNVQNMRNMVDVSDVLVKANTLANASVQQFSESLTNKAASSMKNANMAIEEGVAVLAVFADRGIKGQRAGEKFSQAMRFMQAAAVNNKEALKKYNVEIFDSNGNLNNMADIVESLTNSLAGMTDEQKTAALAEMGFSAETQEVIKTLMGTSDQIREYQKELENAGGATDKVAKNQMKSMKKQLGLVKDLFIEAALEAYEFAKPTMQDLVIPTLKKVVGFIGDVVEKFNELPPGIQKTIGVLSILLITAGPVLALLGQFVSMISGLTPVISAASGAISGAGGLTASLGMLSTSFTPFLVGGVVVAGLALMVKHFRDMKQLSQDIKTDIVDVNNLSEARTELERIREEMEFIENRAKTSGITGAGGLLLDKNTNYQSLKEKEQQLVAIIKGIEKGKQMAVQKTTEILEEEGDRQTENAKEDGDEQTDNLEEDLHQREELRKQFEQSWNDKLFNLTHSRIEIFQREKEQAIDKAEELGADTSAIREYYEEKITQIKEEEIESREQLLKGEEKQEETTVQAIYNKRKNFEERWNDKYYRAAHNRIEILKWEKQKALTEAEELGAGKANILEYYELQIQEALEEEQETRDRNLEEEKTNTKIIEEVMARKNREIELAIDKYNILGNEIDINSAIANSYKKAIITLLEKGISPSSIAVKQLSTNYNELKESMKSGKEELTDTQKILNSLKEKLEIARKKGIVFGDSFNMISAQSGYLKNAINDLIVNGIDIQDNRLQILIQTYQELKDQADDTYNSLIKANNEAISFAGFEGFEHGRIISVDEMLDEHNSWFGFSEEPEGNSVTTQNIDVTVNQKVTDKATAEFSNSDLLDKLQEKGSGLL